MPRKNKEEYNEYMRNYMKKRSREQNGIPVLDNDFDPSSTSQNGKPVLDLNDTSKLIRQTKSLLTTPENRNNNDDDPILKAIDRYGKYVPLVLQFFQGLQGSLASANQGKQAPQIQAPQGWLSMSPMQRINYKYSRPEWFAAGEQYENASETGYMNPQVNTTYVDSTYKQPPAQNLQALSKKYPEPPMASDAPARAAEPAPARVEPAPAPVEQPKTEDGSKRIVAELQADNLRYINLGASYLNDMTTTDFKKNLENVDALVLKGKPFIPLIPVQVKGMIFQTTKQEFEDLFKEKCPEKFALAKKLKKLGKLHELIEKLKAEIAPKQQSI